MIALHSAKRPYGFWQKTTTLGVLIGTALGVTALGGSSACNAPPEDPEFDPSTPYDDGLPAVSPDDQLPPSDDSADRLPDAVETPDEAQIAEGTNSHATAVVDVTADPTAAVAEAVDGMLASQDSSPSVDNSRILYHGGRMVPTVTVYMIYYGNWSTHGASITRINDFLRGLHANNLSSDWLGTTHAYTDSAGFHAGTVINAGAHTIVGYTAGKNLIDTATNHPLFHIVDDAIRSKKLPNDPTGLYLVLAASDVNVVSTIGAFCTKICGFHTLSGSVKWGVIMNDVRCGASCRGTASLPNKDSIADPAVNIIAHELTETATDFDGKGWFDTVGKNEFEDADKCNFTFSNVSHLPNRGVANIHDRALNRFWLIVMFSELRRWLASVGANVRIAVSTKTGRPTCWWRLRAAFRHWGSFPMEAAVIAERTAVMAERPMMGHLLGSHRCSPGEART